MDRRTWIGGGRNSGVSVTVADRAQEFSADRLAERFVAARLSATALPSFPGALPADLATAYRVQDAAIAMWPDEVIGWKVGRVPPEHEGPLKAARLFGPTFNRAFHLVKPGDLTDIPVFVGGFAAIEAEYVVRIGTDAPADKLDWTVDEAKGLVGAMHIGMEPASSPFPDINVIGPLAVVSDFGNNAGLLVGAEIADWAERPLEELRCETLIEGEVKGQGGAFILPGGPLRSLRLLAENVARRGRPLKAGQYVCTGAAAGIIEIQAGQTGAVRFEGYGEIRCRAVPAQAS